MKQATEIKKLDRIASFNPQDGINAQSHRKENHFYKEYAVISFDNGKFYNPITLRCYATNSTHYACMWLHSKDYVTSASGSGKAGGYGYHRESAAVSNAMNAAGIQFAKSIDGVGESAIREALTELAGLLGAENFTIHEAHA